MMKTLKNMGPYLAVNALDFYGLPLFIKNTGTGMLLLLVIMPLVCLICAAFYGARHGFHWQYTVLTAALFVPTIFIYYNSSAAVYVLAYGAAALIGNLLGRLFFREDGRK